MRSTMLRRTSVVAAVLISGCATTAQSGGGEQVRPEITMSTEPGQEPDWVWAGAFADGSGFHARGIGRNNAEGASRSEQAEAAAREAVAALFLELASPEVPDESEEVLRQQLAQAATVRLSHDFGAERTVKQADLGFDAALEKLRRHLVVSAELETKLRSALEPFVTAHPAGNRTPPEWIGQESQVPEETRRSFRSSGRSAGMRNQSLARSTADSRARAELAKTFQLATASMFRNLANPVAVDAKTVADEEKRGASVRELSASLLDTVEVRGRWYDVARDEHHALAELHLEPAHNTKLRDLGVDQASAEVFYRGLIQIR